MPLKQIAAGLIFCDGKILIGQRRRDKPSALLWEFPGGKLEDGETLEDCLKRELLEEMNLQIEVKGFFMRSVYENICLNAYLASCQHQQIDTLTAHEKYCWILPTDLAHYQLAPADIPIAHAICEAWLQKKI